MAGPYENAKPTPARDMGAIALSKTVNSIVGTTATLITRPTTSGPDGVLYLQADLGDWRIRAGDYVGFAFVDGDVTVGDDTIDETSHGYDTGDGPFQLSNSGGDLPAGLAVTTDYWIIKVDDDTISLATTLALAQAGTKLDITAAAGGGTHSLGLFADVLSTVDPAASISDGYGAQKLGAGATMIVSAPSKLTVKGFGATDVLTYWFA